MRLTNNLLLGATALVVSLGCAPSNPGLVAQGALFVDTSCSVTSTSPLLGAGTLDIAPGDVIPRDAITYRVYLQVGNQLLNNGQSVYPLRADPNVILINHVEVTLLGTNEQPLALGIPNPYLVLANGSIPSTTSNQPMLGIARAQIIPNSVGQLLATTFGGQPGSEIVVRLRVTGTTAGGADLTSGPIVFPIRLCVGCLFQCAVDTMGRRIPMPACAPGQDTNYCGG